MTVIGIMLLAAGLVVVVSLALADPVLLSRINGEPAEGASGRHIQVPQVAAGGEVVRLRPRLVDSREPQAA
ncbi:MULTISPECIES: hypothetical protein [Streptosporangium]|uniref:Uncharacterized protein n=1 Tax=Streptosporangium brasiliense TaxID=47480 RepID=A0ABT9R803_9ACTN|nr:hypothetical protein [Streptosporangium brasiliense]MDP9865026.1 hypothetical protein [Streptosporangium brasiliense]